MYKNRVYENSQMPVTIETFYRIFDGRCIPDAGDYFNKACKIKSKKS